MTFRDLAKRLHPDAIGGDHSKVVEFTELMRQRRLLCACGCGRQRAANRTRYFNHLCYIRHRYYPQALTVAVVLACLGAGFQMPPKPTAKKRPAKLQSPRGAELYSAVPMAVATPPKTYRLVWSYPLPLPQPGIEFVVEMRPDLNSPWQTLGVTNLGSYPIDTVAPQMMYRVGSRYK